MRFKFRLAKDLLRNPLRINWRQPLANRSLVHDRSLVASDGPMIDYNRKSVGLAFRLR